MFLVKSTLTYKADTVEKGNISSILMEVVGETDTTYKLCDTNVGYEEEISKDFKGRFNIEDNELYLIKVSLYREVKKGEEIVDVFKKNEKNIKKKSLVHIRNTIMMYKELYSNVIKIIDKFDVHKHYDKDEVKPWAGIKEI